MVVKIQSLGDNVTLLISGRFDFDCHRDFRGCVEEALGRPGVKAIDVDLSQVVYLDSSALGMLLVLLDKATKAGLGAITLKGVKGMVQEVLNVANFDRMFTITS